MLGRKITKPSNNDKTSFCFDFSDIDKPGQLINVMKLFSDENINITKIESRPSKKELGKYIFWMDVIGHAEEFKLKKIFTNINTLTSKFKIIGSLSYCKQGYLIFIFRFFVIFLIYEFINFVKYIFRRFNSKVI